MDVPSGTLAPGGGRRAGGGGPGRKEGKPGEGRPREVGRERVGDGFGPLHLRAVAARDAP